jgi:hypothetical protein
MLAFPPTRADLLALLAAFVVVYCLLEGRWEALASLALVIAAFAVAFPRVIRWRMSPTEVDAQLTDPTIIGDYERWPAAGPASPPARPRSLEDLRRSAREKGSAED